MQEKINPPVLIEAGGCNIGKPNQQRTRVWRIITTRISLISSSLLNFIPVSFIFVLSNDKAKIAINALSVTIH
ncbi:MULTISPECIES: hypothetical protein [unclassified Thalassotalea]|uniref:hypothetical protein n=1 Tax=unclassified Thalassotalea TaxID=2614972 RepID=UPI00108091BB|nr:MULTISPECIES: hypothetical protein [unclassified Thalassotalea]NMP16269.1 hypothetical protein [Thalassotalea sp. Y01]QBY04311.1 hypothetical protein E2K93_07865 [Thalassotalea sp. HSM 43]